MQAIAPFCPCLGAGDDNAGMELKPMKAANSDDEAAAAGSSSNLPTSGLLGMALRPGCDMKLLTAKGPVPVRLALSRDSAMLTYQSLGGATESGVISLAIVREVKPVVAGGILRSQTPVPLQWSVVADDETLRLEAPTETVKDQWMRTVAELSKRQADAKVERKMGYTRKKLHDLDERKKEAERRKAAVLATCGSSGMKHTAAAMMNRR
ncbi:hypothetical protein EMIHUDRAFT_454675 [Emiliania huxleyi CCMP1516]|uniref:PH domain-containing protein n=2 Tax=Emiliania huxleyi TaxID=2903 RepID=A0A0D3KRW4_EMIH1|nr:hypothetical protein EMIHUDRAFT_454675 [Emiliania huxleyi CCMP1516]EOD38499.1 hypothetical protein EMIHUDRAFT_454675 [Emiliania huxleyi CCMP1516]|eukprot:XP_005790928.1 hypothetical protein EMIHUDRAFT_454675 [Emiliania huxleyi CCMP1516]